MIRFVLSLPLVLLFAPMVAAADLRADVLSEPAPADVAPEIAQKLAPTGIKVLRGARTVCDLWMCQVWDSKPGFTATAEVLYPFQPGQLVGVVRFPRKASDFRDQDIEGGVYTLRYGQQPVDGAHVGTSPTRDFLVVIRAAEDKSAGVLDLKVMNKASAAVAGSNHPVMLCLQKVQGTDAAPSLRHDERHDWWILRVRSGLKDGDKSKPLDVELVVVGKAAE